MYLQGIKRLKILYITILPTSSDSNCEPATHCLQVSTTSKMHMLIQISRISYSVHDLVTMPCVVIGLTEVWGGKTALTDEWKWKDVRVITFKSFSWFRMEGRGAGGSIDSAVGDRMKLCKDEEEHDLLKWNLCFEAGEEGSWGAKGSKGDDRLSCRVKVWEKGARTENERWMAENLNSQYAMFLH